MLGPTDSRCGITLALNPQTIGGGGGTGTLTVTTARECTWSVSSSGDWVSFTGATQGQGTASVPYSVSPNRTLQARTAEVAVAGERTMLMQQAATCNFAVTPQAETVGNEGGVIQLSLAADDFCQWSASSSASWLTITTPTSGTGQSQVSVRVAANTGAQRAGTVEVAGIGVTITQRAAPGPNPPPIPPVPPDPACTFTVSPLAFDNINASGATHTVSVTTTAGCAWTASSIDDWLTVSPAGGSGSGSVTLTVAANSTGPRSATATIAGRSVTVSQNPTPCAFSLKPTSYSAPITASTVDVAISTTAFCAWTVSGLPSWATAKPSSGTGSAATTLSIEANPAPPRSATVVIGTQNFALSQAGCTYSIDPTAFNNVPGAGGSVTVTVKTQSGCEWSANGYPTWITLKPSSGTGAGSTVVTASANTGAARNATFDIARQNFTVSQQALSCTYTVNPTSISVSSGSTKKTIDVTTQAGCPVGATTNVSWITITSVPPAGGGSVTLAIAANNNTTSRNGNVVITGMNFTSTVVVTQQGK